LGAICAAAPCLALVLAMDAGAGGACPTEEGPWSTPLPVMEVVRQEWLSWHHRRFALAVSRLALHGSSKTMRAIQEGGLMAGLQGAHARLLIALHRTQPSPAVDPLLPHAPGVEEKDTRKELVVAGVPVDVAVRLTVDMANDLAAAAKACAAAFATISSAHRDPALNAITVLPPPAGEEHVVGLLFTPSAPDVAEWLQPPALDSPVPKDRRFGTVNKPLYAHTPGFAAAIAAAGQRITANSVVMPITRAHLRKLALLHVLTVAGVDNPDRLSPSHIVLLRELQDACQPLRAGTALSPSQAVFLQRSWCVLARYETFTGNAAGLQGAVTHASFDALEAILGVHGECFASPLNCHFPVYCSAFPDTDAPFGSVGSFHTWSPRSGCFEANPPFVNDAMLAMARRLMELLDGAQERGDRLAFFVVVPAWSDAYFHKLLAGRARYSATLHRKEHDFIDGAQYRSERSTWAANVDSSIFLLATDAAVAAAGWAGDAGADMWYYVVDSQSSTPTTPYARPASALGLVAAAGAAGDATIAACATGSGAASSSTLTAIATGTGKGTVAATAVVHRGPRVFKWAV